ncbi:FAD-dependent oxidoreductase [Lactobacillus sp. LL6]|uniref:FAD-dependent oxidoreductase n=1 Tax=Lactobacillus sp. LL6 TaxID=2596827 RepID=UPI0011859C01|nr:FAD-dependent oxidoreductase [Lactobacillus sp. LL6]TSO25460.1 FAD-dependent oxidoreductase [Lactobacillus sp. LL6]
MLPKNDKYDLVIIGSGLSGQAASVEAAKKGLKTLVVEQGRTTGGSGNYVEGIFAVGSKMQEEQGIDLTQDDILQKELRFSHYDADTRILKEYIANSAANIEWLKELGIKFKAVTTIGAGLKTWHLFDGQGQAAIHQAMEPYSKKHGVEFITSAAVTKITQDIDGLVNGVIIQNYENKDIKLVQTSNIIIASGGYLNNREMLVDYSNQNANRIVPVNSGKNDGSGLRMAWEVGAKRFKMGISMLFGGQLNTKTVPSYKLWKNDLGIATCEMAPLWVNEVGKRFVNESIFDIWSYAGNALIQQEKVYAILDQGTIDHFSHELPRNLQPLSDKTSLNNLKNEIKNAKDKNMKFITKADTIYQLATKLNLPHLDETIKSYNKEANIGADEEFEKESKYLYPIEKPPYYAFELGVGAYSTLGGLRINEKCEVLDKDGRPIPGLFAIGADASGMIVGDTYGVNVPGTEAGFCIYSGRKAVQTIEA